MTTRTMNARRLHRQVSVIFVVLVVVNIVSALAGGPEWIGYLAVPPILLLLATGIPLYLRPVLNRTQGARVVSRR